jgi:hypothetical protein
MVHQAVKRCGIHGSFCDVPYENSFDQQTMACCIAASFTAGSRSLAQDVQK